MKIRTTKKAVNAAYTNRIMVPYADLCYLLNGQSPVAYTSRREGWGADIYDYGDTAIVTGYDPWGNVRPKYEMRRKYEERAREICRRTHNYQERKAKLYALTQKFIKEAVEFKGK